jgi:hypothetical protein
MSRRWVRLVGGSVACLAALARPAFAGPTEDTRRPTAPTSSTETAAEAAFTAGRALMREGRYEEACKKLETSNSLDPAVGTLLNLGECFERSGRNASAWVRYREAAGMALRANQREREQIARDKAAELEPLLCHVIVHAPKGDLVVRRDGQTIDPSALDLPVPVDPGAHVVDGTIDGQVVVRQDVVVRAPEAGQPCKDVVVTLPATAIPPRKQAATAPAADPGWYSTGRGVALGAFGLGVAGAAIGTVFGLSASSIQDEAEPFCKPEGCTTQGRNRLIDAGDRADVSTVAFVAASALVVTGVVLWIVSAPSGKKSVGEAAPLLRF